MWVAPRYGGLTAEGFNLQARRPNRAWPVALPFFAYYLCLEWWFGATLGRWWRLRITGVDGGRIDLRRSLFATCSG